MASVPPTATSRSGSLVVGGPGTDPCPPSMNTSAARSAAGRRRPAAPICDTASSRPQLRSTEVRQCVEPPVPHRPGPVRGAPSRPGSPQTAVVMIDGEHDRAGPAAAARNHTVDRPQYGRSRRTANLVQPQPPRTAAYSATTLVQRHEPAGGERMGTTPAGSTTGSSAGSPSAAGSTAISIAGRRRVGGARHRHHGTDVR